LKITEENTLKETRITKIALSNMFRVQILAALAEIASETITIREIALLKPFSSTFFSWSVFCNSL